MMTKKIRAVGAAILAVLWLALAAFACCSSALMVRTPFFRGSRLPYGGEKLNTKEGL